MKMKSKRKNMLLAFMLLFSMGLQAQHITEAQALQKATEFLNSKVTAIANGHHGAPARHRTLHRVAQPATATDALYLFNDEDNGGFVIVSGDERTKAILGYSTEGKIDVANMPDNMRAWIEGYERQINEMPADAQPALMPTITEAPIEPLITTYWGQSYPYFLQTPEVDAQQCVTGCVATTMAQVMNYWQYPEKTVTAIPAWRGLDEVPASTAIDWSNMCPRYEYEGTGYYSDENGSPIELHNTEAQCTAVAQLMKMCGMAVKMQYGVSESGAYASDIIPALTNYFGYQSDMKYLFQSSYNYKNWQTILYGELVQQRPIIYDGRNDPKDFFKGEVGHSFIIDGYSDADYFHFNWGRDGYDNGYFTLAVNEYFRNCGAVVGVQPTPGAAIADVETVKAFTDNASVLELVGVVADGPIYEYDSYGKSNVILRLRNNGDVDFKGYIEVWFESGFKWGRSVLAEVPAGETAEVVLPGYAVFLDYGDYEVKVVHFRSSADEEWVYIDGSFPLKVERRRIPTVNITYTIEGLEEKGVLGMDGIDDFDFNSKDHPVKIHYKIAPLWEGDPTVKAKLYWTKIFREMYGEWPFTLDLGHLTYGNPVEGDIELTDYICSYVETGNDIFPFIELRPALEFYTDTETTAYLDFRYDNAVQRPEAMRVLMYDNSEGKPVFAEEPVEITDFQLNDWGFIEDMPAGYYVLEQDGFTSFQSLDLKDEEIWQNVYSLEYNRAWSDYQLGIADRRSLQIGEARKASKNLFDCPSEIPYESNNVIETIDGKTVYFPCDSLSLVEAAGRGLYKNRVGWLHQMGGLEVRDINVYPGKYFFVGAYFLPPHIYYYPFVQTAVGDVNGDGEVDIADIAAVINVMAGTTKKRNYHWRADVNHDGKTDNADIVAIINIMAGK